MDSCRRRIITNGINGLRGRVRSLSQGIETEISLVLDAVVPTTPMVDGKAFRAELPMVSLRRYTDALGAVTQMVLDGTATIGIFGALDEAVVGIERIGVRNVDWIQNGRQL